MASSSFTNGTSWKYDVFLNFRGDIRKSFISHLDRALRDREISTYLDEHLERGKEISSALFEAIESSRMSILVFSKNYASSIYCLDELVKILECQKSKGQIVVPIFYDVDPDEVQQQSGRYGEAFTSYESEKDVKVKVKVWKAALKEAAYFAGWPLQNGNEADFIQQIVKGVHGKLNEKVQMESTPFSELIPSQPNGLIKVRIARIWKTKSRGTGQILSVDCLLVNEKNEAIQGTMKEVVAAHFGANIEQGSVYEIRDYFVWNEKSTYKVVDQTSMLEFSKNTSFKKVDDDAAIPLHKFNFIDFTDLNARIDNRVLLTDVIGLLVAVGSIEHTYVFDKLAPMRNMKIQDLRDKELPVTLWGDLATEFDENALKTMTPPVIIVLAAMMVKQFKGETSVASALSTMYFFNPDIREVQGYKSRFEGIAKPIRTLPSSNTSPVHPSEHRNFNRKKISDIQKMNPYSHRSELFTCKATIDKFDTTNGWWYAICPTCNSINVRKNGNEWWCDIDGSFANTPILRLRCTLRDDTGTLDVTIYKKQAQSMIGQSFWDLEISIGIADPKVLPPMISQINGATRIFQLYFGGKKASNRKIDLVVSKVFEDDQQPTISSTKRKPFTSPNHQQSLAKRMKEGGLDV